MRLRCVAMLALLILTACNAKPIRPDRQESGSSDPTAAPISTVVPGMDIGTVEDAIKIEAMIADADRGLTMVVEEERTYKKDLTLITVDVTDPVPDELWTTFEVTSKESFQTRPVVVKLSVWREVGVGRAAIENREKIGSFNVVLGEDANRKRKADGTPLPQPTTRINAFEGLTDFPETMLIHGEAELLYLPDGTPESIVNPDTATADPLDTTLKTGNPIRINFASAPADAS